MPKAVRIALPIVLLAAVYAGWAPIEALTADAGDAGDAMWFVWSAAVLGAGSANVVNACLDRGEGSPRRLAFWDMLLKLCLIPFFLFVFVAGFVMSLALAVVPGLIFGAPVVVGILVVVDYGLLLFTSSYGFAAVARARSRGLITGTAAAVLSVLHALFITDVVAAIVLYAMVRRADDASQSPEGYASSERVSPGALPPTE